VVVDPAGDPDPDAAHGHVLAHGESFETRIERRHAIRHLLDGEVVLDGVVDTLRVSHRLHSHDDDTPFKVSTETGRSACASPAHAERCHVAPRPRLRKLPDDVGPEP
jgi:hypothetical protein